MKVLAFNGSPRKNGNTELLLREALKGVQESGGEVTRYNLNDLDISPCQNCGGCDETGACIIPDEMQAIHQAIRAADQIILASPIFFSGLSAQTKVMIDRCQAIWAEKYVHKKPIPPGRFGRKGLLLVVGGMKLTEKNKGFECAEATARAFLRTINVQEHVTLAYDAIDAKGEILKHPTALKDAYEAGRELAR